jgi:hypothetical protein
MQHGTINMAIRRERIQGSREAKMGIKIGRSKGMEKLYRNR